MQKSDFAPEVFRREKLEQKWAAQDEYVARESMQAGAGNCYESVLPCLNLSTPSQNCLIRQLI
jgi:hypothetical protein